MKILFALLVVALLAVSSAGLVQSSGPDPAPALGVESGTITGGSYRLVILTWSVSGAASGGGYALDAAYLPTLRGNGCCCTYLPCLLRNP